MLRNSLKNVLEDYCTGFQGYCTRLKAFIRDNIAYTKARLERAKPDDPYWQSVSPLLKLDLETIHCLGEASLSSIDWPLAWIFKCKFWAVNSLRLAPNFDGKCNSSIFLLLQLQWKSGDFYDLESKLNKTKDPVEEDGIIGGKCSGLIKVPISALRLTLSFFLSRWHPTMRTCSFHK